MQSLVKFFKCGVTYYDYEGLAFYFVVSKFDDVYNNIIPFFEKYPLQSSKLANYQDFHSVALMMKEKKKHLTTEGLTEIINIKSGMDRGRV